ncbi:hypothetical protein HQ520_13355 [bacterium]|nr:hypothetical protein [bacterium]
MRWLILLLALGLAGPGCVTTPAMSKSNYGNLEVNVYSMAGNGLDKRTWSISTPVDLYVDGLFVSSVTTSKPVLFLKRGEHRIEVRALGYQPIEKTITILGEPNHQVFEIRLDPLTE